MPPHYATLSIANEDGDTELKEMPMNGKHLHQLPHLAWPATRPCSISSMSASTARASWTEAHALKHVLPANCSSCEIPDCMSRLRFVRGVPPGGARYCEKRRR